METKIHLYTNILDSSIIKTNKNIKQKNVYSLSENNKRYIKFRYKLKITFEQWNATRIVMKNGVFDRYDTIYVASDCADFK